MNTLPKDLLGEISKKLKRKEDKAAFAATRPDTLHLMPKVSKFEQFWMAILKKGLAPNEMIVMVKDNPSVTILVTYYDKNTIIFQVQVNDPADDMQASIKPIFTLFDNELAKHALTIKNKVRTQMNVNIPHIKTYYFPTKPVAQLVALFKEFTIHCYKTFSNFRVSVLNFRGEELYPDFMEELRKAASTRKTKYILQTTAQSPVNNNTDPSIQKAIREITNGMKGVRGTSDMLKLHKEGTLRHTLINDRVKNRIALEKLGTVGGKNTNRKY